MVAARRCFHLLFIETREHKIYLNAAMGALAQVCSVIDFQVRICYRTVNAFLIFQVFTWIKLFNYLNLMVFVLKKSIMLLTDPSRQQIRF